MYKEIICIACPRGCRLMISFEAGSPKAEDLVIEGNQCPKGIDYGRQEILQPRRMLCSTVKTTHKDYPRLPVRLTAEIPKDKLMQCMKIINSVEIKSSCSPGDVLLSDVIEKGVNLIATGRLEYER